MSRQRLGRLLWAGVGIAIIAGIIIFGDQYPVPVLGGTALWGSISLFAIALETREADRKLKEQGEALEVMSPREVVKEVLLPLFFGETTN